MHNVGSIPEIEDIGEALTAIVASNSVPFNHEELVIENQAQATTDTLKDSEPPRAQNPVIHT